jgi:thioredoxin-like negative regulator of GroEL
MTKTITFYWHPECDGCHELKPIIKEVARIKKWRFEEVNIDNCDNEICQSLEYVPTIFIDGRKLSIEEMEKLF